jgi:hypothetical protein
MLNCALWLLLSTNAPSVLPLQVIPIYGRGSDFDPRQEAIKVQPVPPRPAGQRPSAVQVSRLASAAHQAGGKHTSIKPSTCLAERTVVGSLYLTDQTPPCAVQPTAPSAVIANVQHFSRCAAVVGSMQLGTCVTHTHPLVHGQDACLHVHRCRSCYAAVVQAGAAGGNQQGVLPALFGFQLGPGTRL